MSNTHWTIRLLGSLPTRVLQRAIFLVSTALIAFLVLVIMGIWYSEIAYTVLAVLLIIFLLYFAWATIPQLQTPFGSNVWKGLALLDDPKKLLLTFDDAPSQITKKLLDILDGYGIKAIFFVLGQNCKIHPEEVSEVVKRGHVVGCHGNQHRVYLWKSSGYITQDISQCLELLREHFQIQTSLFRSPHGQRSYFLSKVLKKLGLTHLSWHRGFWDTDLDVTAETLVSRAKKVQGGEILLFHDGVDIQKNPDRSHLLKALPQIIEMLQEMGYQFENPHTYCQATLGFPVTTPKDPKEHRNY